MNNSEVNKILISNGLIILIDRLDDTKFCKEIILNQLKTNYNKDLDWVYSLFNEITISSKSPEN